MQQHKKITHHGQVRYIPEINVELVYDLKSINVIHHICKLKKENHTGISKDIVKNILKTQHSFHIKTVRKLEIEGTSLN